MICFEQYQCNALKRLCISECIDEWKVDQCLKAEQKYQCESCVFCNLYYTSHDKIVLIEHCLPRGSLKMYKFNS